ncbi:MAG: indole-3-glycerol phosphate synthase TrpC [Ruminococcus sp.]|jgi:indole-3-glycerol phosphate synthase|nr:indole-3-glycerol phosphate synthase TrpC [Ruminococcus sp.]
MGTILDTLREKSIARVEAAKREKPLAQMRAEAENLTKNTGFPFEAAIGKSGLSFICEVKKASPSKGIIAEDFPYLDIAKEYAAGGADAISVLTEPEYFMGDTRYLREISKSVNVPTLRKDFIVDDYQIYEAKVCGAAAVLLIVSILSETDLKAFIKLAETLGMSALVEAHTADEIKVAAHCGGGAKIIGVNNRNLSDFSVDTENAAKLRAAVPPGILYVSESGIKGKDDIIRAKNIGADAVLIGESLMRAEDKAAFIRELKHYAD